MTTHTNRRQLTGTAEAYPQRRSFSVRHHKLPLCATTGLPRYRDRHQARDGAAAMTAGGTIFTVSSFACPECHGFHLRKMHPVEPVSSRSAEPVAVFAASIPTRTRRYVLVDIENPTCGARATVEEVATFWTILRQQAPGISPRDHVVVGASRRVADKYRPAIEGPNVKWVVGADGPDGADRALLAAIDLHRVARDYDELVIVSGDHAFSGLARRAKSFGLAVRVVTAEHPRQRKVLARDLSAAADTHTLVRLTPRLHSAGHTSSVSSAGLIHRNVHEAGVVAA